MPDTEPITTSFPYLTKRHRAVFDNRNIVGTSSAATGAFQSAGFQVSPAFQTAVITLSPGDVYRYI